MIAILSREKTCGPSVRAAATAVGREAACVMMNLALVSRS